MAVNKYGINIDYKCNNCGTTESVKWIKDKQKGIGWKCLVCYNEYYKASRIVKSGGNRRQTSGKAMLKILEYLVKCKLENDNNDYHTVTSISNEIGLNYHSTLKAIRLIDATNKYFFSLYDVEVRRLRTSKITSNKSKMEVITIRKRRDCEENKK